MDKQIENLIKIVKRPKTLLIENKINLINTEILSNEKSNFVNNVTSSVEFGKFQVFDDDVQWEIYLKNIESKIIMSFKKNEGLLIQCNLTKLNEEFVETINNLKKYYSNWRDEWRAKYLS
jgi:hypothetical protein